MPTLRELIDHLETHADELGDDYPVLYYNPLTQGYEELELTVSTEFIGEDIDAEPEFSCVLIHSSDEILEDDTDDDCPG